MFILRIKGYGNIYIRKSTLVFYQNYVIKEDHQLILFVYLDIIRGKYIHKKEDVLWKFVKEYLTLKGQNELRSIATQDRMKSSK